MCLLKRLHYIWEVFSVNKNGLGLLTMVMGSLLLSATVQSVQADETVSSMTTTSAVSKEHSQSQQATEQTNQVKNQMGKIIVHYIDEQGHIIAPERTCSDHIGGYFTMQPIEITGYTYHHYSGNVPAGTFQEQTQEFTFVYQKTTVSNQRKVVIQFVDESGQHLKADRMQVGQLDTNYKIVPDQITGYTFLKSEGQLNGSYQKDDNLVKLVYQKIPTQGELIIQYIDQNGQAIIEPGLMNGNVGAAYTINAKQITGYQLVSSQIINGQYHANKQTIQFRYQKDSRQPIANNTKYQQVTNKLPTKAKPTTTNQTTAQLPQTGTNSTSKLVATGLIFATVGLLSMLVKHF